MLEKLVSLPSNVQKAWVHAESIKAHCEARGLLSSPQCSSALAERYDVNHHCASMDCYRLINSGNTPQSPKHKTTPVAMQGWPS